MHPKMKDPFTLMGIEIRTSNAGNQAQTEIPALWQRFFAENILLTIPNKRSENVFVLYTDYEKDHTAPYTCFIGCEVSSTDTEKIPKGMIRRTIPSQTYSVFEIRGSYPDSLMKAWQEIWKGSIPRSYGADFEIYTPEFFKKQNSHMQIYIAIQTQESSACCCP